MELGGTGLGQYETALLGDLPVAQFELDPGADVTVTFTNWITNPYLAQPPTGGLELDIG